MAQKPPGSSLTVLGGPLDGTAFRLADSGELLIGSDGRCGLRLMLPGIAPLHARLRLGPGQAQVTDPGGTAGVFVNDEPVAGTRSLRHGDVVWLGPPGGEQSVMLQCRLSSPPVAGTAPVAASASAPAPPAAVGEADFFVADEAATPSFESAEPAAAPEDPFFVGEAREPAAPALAADDEFLVVDTTPPAAAAAAPRPTSSVGAPPDLGPPVFEAPERGAPELEAPRVAPPQPILPARMPPPPVAVAAPMPARPEAPAASPPAPRPPAPAPAARPAAASPAARARSMDRPSGPRRVPVAAPAPARRGDAGRSLQVGALVLVVLVLAGGGAALWSWFSTPRLAGVQPARSRAGQTVVLTGTHFASAPGNNVVRFGSRPAKVVKATSERLEVTVPDLDLAPGADTRVAVVVDVGGRASAPVEVTVYQGPRLHGLLPDVAQPGETVELRGAGWTAGAVVRFGEREAEVLEMRPDAIRVKVPEIPGPPGTEAPVTVSMGEAASNPGPFFVGRLPLIVKIEPASAAPGDVVTVSGKGFVTQPAALRVRLGERPALLLAATESSLRLVLPRVDPGSTQLHVELLAAGLANQAEFTVAGSAADTVDFQFVAEPLEEDAAHAVLATALGPAFVFSASGGQSAAVRALEAQKRLNAAAVPLKAALEADLEVREFASGRPLIALKGQPGPLFEVTAEDAAGYDKDWTRLGARQRPVTPGRLATWWLAVARDLVLVLLRNQKPQFAAALAPEGRVLADLHQAASKQGRWGVPRQVLAEAKPPLLQGLRVLGLRVPPSVSEPAGTPAAAQATATQQALAAFKLDGEWRGRETVPEGSRYITLFFRGKTGTFELASGPGVGFPLSQLEQPQKGGVRFSIFVAGGVRTYSGRYDGEKISGTVSAGPDGPSLGTFELVPR